MKTVTLNIPDSLELVGFSKRTFAELLGKYNVSIVIILPLIYPGTLPMRKIIISDTSCFIVLSNIGEPDILHKV